MKRNKGSNASDGFSGEDYKRHTRENWGGNPCGAHYSALEERDGLAYYEDVEKKRYQMQDWLLRDLLDFEIEDQEVLEIGYGMGTDHLQMARRGGRMHGVDITPNNQRITRERMRLYGFQSDLRVGDAEQLRYPDNFFDFVYSFGVLHHTPDMERAVREVYRVLKPGGKAYIALYNKNSLFFYWTVFMYHWILCGERRTMTLKQRLSMIEYPNNNPGLVVKLHTKKELRRVFQDFEVKSIDVNHLTRDCIGSRLEKLFSDAAIRRLASKVGWYLIVTAQKPG